MFTASTTIRALLLAACLYLAPAAMTLDPQLRFWQYAFDSPPPESHLDSDVLDVAQSADGFLWLATGRGLARFDGFDTVLYRVADHPGLMSNQPTELLVTADNQLLIASQSGISRYDGQRFEPLLSANQWTAAIHAIAEDADGNIWLGSENGLGIMRGAQLDTAPFAGRVQQVISLVVHGDTVYAGGQGVLYKIIGDDVTVLPLRGALVGQRIQDLVVHRGQIYGATHRGMFVLNDDRPTHLDHDLVAELHVDILLSDRHGNLWFGGERALGRFYPNGAIELPNVEDEALGYVPQLSAMLEDRQGRLWHSSAFFGLVSLRDTSVRRVSYTEGLHSPNVDAIGRDAVGTVFVATDKGISALTGDSIASLVKEDFARSSRVQALVADDQRQLWVGTQSGLRRLDLQTGRWQVAPEQQQPALGVNALALARGADDGLWAATDSGLHRISGNKTRIVPATAQMAIKSLHVASDGPVWLGTERGLKSLSGDRITPHATGLPGGIGTVTAIVERPDGQIIAATASNGIIAQSNGQWRGFDEVDGLPPERLIDIELRGSYLWLVTSAGVFRTPVNELDGAGARLDVEPIATRERYRAVHSINCCSGHNTAAALESNGVLVVATDDGIITYDLDATTTAVEQPRPYIRALTIGGVHYAADDPALPAVRADDNLLGIHYSAIDLTRGKQLEFRYRLRGISDAWIHVGSVRSVQLQGLPVGEFEFELQASSAPGSWTGVSVSVPFRRAARFTETVAFQFLIWCASIALVLGLIWLRSAAARRRHSRLEQRITQRTRTLRQLNDELAIKNQSLLHASETDALTGLYNRRYFDSRRNDLELADNMRQEGLLVILDIDHFKTVNDTHGHPAGDEVLRQFADVLRAATRQSDLLARWGGEEFMLLCRCSSTDAPHLLERIVSAVRQHAFILPDGERLPITCSLGGVRFPLWSDHALADQLAILTELADAALYSVKNQGRDGWIMLEGEQPPSFDIKLRRAGPMLGPLVHGGHLRWHASRPQMVAPSPDETRDTGS